MDIAVTSTRSLRTVRRCVALALRFGAVTLASCPHRIGTPYLLTYISTAPEAGQRRGHKVGASALSVVRPLAYLHPCGIRVRDAGDMQLQVRKTPMVAVFLPQSA